MKDVIMPFGKHKGLSLKKIPLSYLAWLLTKYEGYKITKASIEAEALRRGCEKRDGKWGIDRSKLPSKKRSDYEEWGDMDMQVDFLGNCITREYNDDVDTGEDSYSYGGIPNFD